MTDQLDGRDLDRACAEAMGWTTKEFSSATAMVRGKELVWQPPRYSTDPSTQKEKLAWLIPQSCSLYKQVGIAVSDDVDFTGASMQFRGETITAHGTDIDQALARLVVSVAKAKKEQGK